MSEREFIFWLKGYFKNIGSREIRNSHIILIMETLDTVKTNDAGYNDILTRIKELEFLVGSVKIGGDK